MSDSPHILVIDDVPFCRNLVTGALRAGGFRATGVGDGVSAIGALSIEQYSLVILDIEMPGMDGLGVLQHMHDKGMSGVAVIMLTSSADRDHVIRARKLGASEYVLKSQFSVDTLMQRVKKVLGDMAKPRKPQETFKPNDRDGAHIDLKDVPNLLPRDLSLRMIEMIDKAAPSLNTARDVIDACGQAKAGPGPIIAAVRNDPLIALRVFAAAGAKGVPAGSVEEAVRSLGPSEIKDLAQSMQDAAGDRVDGYDLDQARQIWRHAHASANVLSRIAPRSDKLSSASVAVMGLMHDIVEMLLADRHPSEYQALLDFANQSQRHPATLVKQVFGVSYGELTSALLTAAAVPAMMANPIIEYAGSFNTEINLSAQARCIRLADEYACALGLCNSFEATLIWRSAGDLRAMSIPNVALNANEIRSETMATASLLGCGPEAEPPAPELRISYIRPPVVAALDPIEVALRRLSRCVPKSSMPARSEEWAECDAVVVSAPRTDVAGFNPIEIEKARRATGRPIPALYIIGEGSSATTGNTSAVLQPVAVASLQRFVAYASSTTARSAAA